MSESTLNGKSSKVSLKNMLLVGGAFSSYTIGSGFATGAEVLQFFGSWGLGADLLGVAVFFIITVYFTQSVYKTGHDYQFSNFMEIYEHYFGKVGARIIDILIVVIVFAFCTSMFAGCGATINQYFGLPVYVGAVLLGAASAFVACLGLKKLIDTLGVIGVAIIVSVVLIGLYAAVVATQSLSDSQANVLTYVEDGKVLQAGVFGMYNSVLAAVNYAGVLLITGFGFYVSLGKDLHNRKEAFTSGIFSAVFFTAGMLLVLVAILFNLDYIVESGAQVPNLAVLQNIAPALEPAFAVILILGIFTTITGYLWLLAGRFAKERTLKSTLIIIGLTVLGVFGGAIIPFNTLVNIVYPYSGLFGMVVFIAIIIRDIRGNKKGAAKE